MEARTRPRGQYSNINLGAPIKKGEIELTDRQLEILRSRQRTNNKFSGGRDPTPQNARMPGKNNLRQDPPPSKPVVRVEKQLAPYQDNWGDQPATTAPTTTWESDSAASSGHSSFTDPTKQFYGQGLKGKERKLYDDTGASFHESKSEATTSSASVPLIRKMTYSASLEKSSSVESSSVESNARSEVSSSVSSASRSVKKTTLEKSKSMGAKSNASSSGSSTGLLAKKMASSAAIVKTTSASGEARSEASTSASSRPPMKQARLSVPATLSESKSHESNADSQTKPLEKQADDSTSHVKTQVSSDEDKIAKTKTAWKEKASKKRASGLFSVARSKTSTLSTDDQQKAFLRKMMQSYPKKGASKNKGNGDESGSEASSKGKARPSRLSFSTRRQSLMSARSASSSSSASHDKAIMRKVLERAKKKKLASNPRKQNFVKTSSTRMKQLLSPKSSRTSDESGNDERSFEENDRRLRREEARLAKRGLSLTPKAKVLKSPVRKMRRSPRNLVENSVSRWSSKTTKSPKPWPHEEQTDHPTQLVSSISDDTASETLSSGSGEDDIQTAEKLESTGKDVISKVPQPTGLNEKPTVPSGLSKTQSKESVSEDEKIKGTGPILKGQLDLNGGDQKSQDIAGEDIDIKVSVSSLSRRYGGASPAIPRSETNRTTPLFSNTTEWNVEPEGYSDFVNTLKSEVASSHSQLWRSFHSLFRGNDRYPTPLVALGEKGAAFDDKTKDMVTNMSAYIKRKYNVECNPGAQLANDKVVKGQATVKKLFGHTPKAHQSGNKSVASSDSIDDMESNEFEVTLGQHVRHSMGGHGVAPVPASEDNEEAESFVGSHASASVYSRNRSQAKNGLPNSKSSEVSGASSGQKTESCVAPSDDSIFEDQTKGGTVKSVGASTFNGSKKRRHETAKETGSDVSIPWSGVKLRSVADPTKSEASSSTSIPASWTKVKLRHVVKKDDSNGSEGSVQARQEIAASESFHRIIVKKPSVERRRMLQAKKTAAVKPKPQVPAIGQSASKPIEIVDVEPSEIIDVTEPREIIDVTEPREIIDVTEPREIVDVTEIELPTDQADSKSTTNESVSSAEGSVVVSLCNESDDDSKNEMKLVIGKRGLMKVEAKPQESKARVIWRLERDDVKSAMLDMSAFKVKLLLEDAQGTRDLNFPSSDQCMRFANALHEMNNAMESENDEDDAADSGDNSVFVEQLSEEEQQVLEEFRQKKKNSPETTDFARKQLTVKSVATEDTTKPFSVIDAFGSNLSSPISEISGTSSNLSGEHSSIAEPYYKMLRLRVPKDAVRHKMEKDQVDPTIIALVLGDGSESDCGASVCTTELSIKEEKEAAVYRRMLKMKVPEDAVRHKMEKDGVATKIIRAVLGGEADEPTEVASSEIQLTDAEQSIATSYKKMLKMMVPKEAVEHKMKKDGVDQKIIVAVVGGSLKKKTAEEKTPSLSDEEESVASSYRQMLKLKISREAVRHKMKQEGIADHIIANVLGEVPRHTPAKQPRKKKVLKAGFHWSPVPSGQNFENSIWAKKKPLIETEMAEGSLAISKHVSEHVEQFQKKPEGEAEPSKKKKNNTDAKVMARLIDINRANNVAISLKAFKEFKNKELAQIIEFVDPFAKITGDRALFMRDLLPAPAEVKVIKNYKGEEDRLVPAEKWFRQIVHIKRIDAKVRLMRTMETFRGEAEELGATFQQLTKACKQVMGSQKLPDLLELVRQIGNRMNEGRGEEAAGFKLDFLPRLAQTKGSDRKTTALDLVVTIFVEQNQRDCLMLHEDLPDCQEASRMQIAELQSEVRTLQGARKKCENELESLKKEASKEGRPPQPAASKLKAKIPMGDSNSESAPHNSNSKKTLRTADTEVRTDVSSMHRELFEKRSQFIDSVLTGCNGPKEDPSNEGKSNENAPSVKELLEAVQTKAAGASKSSMSPRKSLQASQKILNDSFGEMGYTLQSAITRVDTFLSEAGDIFPKLEAERDTAVKTCKELCEFFCEPGGEKSATNLLTMLHEFAENLNQAVKKYDAQQKAQAREKAKQAKKSKATKTPAATKPSSSIAGKPAWLSASSADSTSVEASTSSADSQQANSFTSSLNAGGQAPLHGSPPVDRANEPAGEKKSLVLLVNEMLKIAGDKGKEDFAKGVTYSNPDSRLKQIYEAEEQRKNEDSAADPRAEMLRAISARREKNAGTSSDNKSEDAADVIEAADLTKTFSLEYSTDSSTARNPKPSDIAKPSQMPVKSTKGRKQSIADRWTRKIDDDEVSESVASATFKLNKRRQSPTSSNGDAEDKKENEGSNANTNRWAKPAGTTAAPTPRSVEEESDAGAAMEIKRRTRQRYINRWASKPGDRDDDSE